MSPAAPPSSAKPGADDQGVLDAGAARIPRRAAATPAAGIATSARSTGSPTAPIEAIAAQAVDLLVARIDRQDAAGKAVLAQLVQQAAANAVQVGRGAEHRDRFRPEEAMQCVFAHPRAPRRDVAERHVLVDAHVLRQAEHAFGDDVLHDLVGAAGEAQGGRIEQRFLEDAGDRHVLAHRRAGHADQVEAVRQDVLQLVRRHHLDDRRFRTRRPPRDSAVMPRYLVNFRPCERT